MVAWSETSSTHRQYIGHDYSGLGGASTTSMLSRPIPKRRIDRQRFAALITLPLTGFQHEGCRPRQVRSLDQLGLLKSVFRNQDFGFRTAKISRRFALFPGVVGYQNTVTLSTSRWRTPLGQSTTVEQNW